MPRWTDKQKIADAKRDLIDAECHVTFAPGELDRIGAKHGIKRGLMKRIAYGSVHQNVAPAAPVEG